MTKPKGLLYNKTGSSTFHGVKYIDTGKWENETHADGTKYRVKTVQIYNRDGRFEIILFS